MFDKFLLLYFFFFVVKFMKICLLNGIWEKKVKFEVDGVYVLYNYIICKEVGK